MNMVIFQQNPNSFITLVVQLLQRKNMVAASNTEGWHTSHLQIPCTEGLIHVHKDIQHSTVYN